jgi:hypothetical protein
MRLGRDGERHVSDRGGFAGREHDDTAHDGDDAALERIMADVPKGAWALSGLTVGLLLLAWVLIYAFVFLPRGMVS